MQDIVLNEKLKYIESYAFYECPGLRQLIVPKGVKAIDYKAIGFRAGKGFVIYAVKGGIAEEYARANINNEEASYNPRNFKLLCDKHSYKNVPELAATYSAPGHTAYRYCPKCGVKLGYVETPQLKLKKADGVKISYGETSIKISWNKVKGATNYRIYMYDAKAKKYVIVSKDFTKTSYTFKNLKPGTDYKFAVAPYCKEISNSSGKTVINAATRPVGLSKVKIKKLSKTSAELSWCKVKNADGYRIYRYDAKKDKYVKVTDTTKLNYTFKNLKKGESYKYAVRPYVKADGVVIQSVQMKKLTVKM